MIDLDELSRVPAALPEPFVMWGPFPLRRARLLMGLALVILAGFIGWIGTLRDSVECTRRGPQSGQCVFAGGARGNQQQVFALTSLQLVRVKKTESHRRGRSTPRGQVILHVDGREIALRTESPETAAEHAAELRSFLERDNAQEVRIATERVWWGFVVVTLMGAFGVGLLYSVVSGRRRFRLSYDGAMKQLSITREWPLGLGGSTEALSLRDPREVEIEWGRIEDFWASSRSPAPPGGRLRIRTSDGNTVPIDAKLWAGYGVHLRAAEQLRLHLGCPQRTPAERQRIIDAYEAARPRISPHWSSPFGKVATVWLGACTGSLAGLLVSSTIAVVFRFQKISDPAGGFWYFSGLISGVALGIWLAWRLMQRGDER